MEMRDVDDCGRRGSVLATMRVRCVVRGMVALAGAALLFVVLAFAHPLGASAATVTVNMTKESGSVARAGYG